MLELTEFAVLAVTAEMPMIAHLFTGIPHAVLE